jgi:hypothetical protein
MVTTVRRNPAHVCKVIAVPTYWVGANSVTDAENWAESATIETPQINATEVRTTSEALTRCPMSSAQLALISIAMIVTRGRPIRSATTPAITQPAVPAAMVMKARSAAHRGFMPRPTATKVQNAPIELHIA